MIEIDRILIEKLKEGDIRSFHSIYHFYYPRIYNFCLKLLPDSEDAKDAAQKVFIALWEQRRQIDENRSLGSYIFAIARYTAYHDFKQILYKKAALEEMTSESGSIPEGERDDVLFNELTKVLDRIIEQLPPQRRIIFRLNRFYSMTYKAIADKLRITENTVDTQIRRALAYIREEYGRYVK